MSDSQAVTSLYLTQARDNLKDNAQELYISCLLAHATLHLHRLDLDRTTMVLGEAMDVARRGQIKLAEAACTLLFARLEAARMNPPLTPPVSTQPGSA